MPAHGIIVQVRDSASDLDTESRTQWAHLPLFSLYVELTNCHPAVVSQFHSRLSCDNLLV